MPRIQYRRCLLGTKAICKTVKQPTNKEIGWQPNSAQNSSRLVPKQVQIYNRCSMRQLSRQKRNYNNSRTWEYYPIQVPNYIKITRRQGRMSVADAVHFYLFACAFEYWISFINFYKYLLMMALMRSFGRFGTLNAQYLANKSRNAVRFQSQNILWDFEQVNFQSQAFAKGLASLNFKKNDNFLLRLPSSQQAEAYIAKLGVSGLNGNLIVSKGTTAEQIDNEIKSNDIKSIIFEPTLTVKEDQFIDVLNKLIPELSATRNGEVLKSTKYPSLSTLIQTNFYSYPGVFKFRSILNYAEDKYFKLQNNPQFEPIRLPETSNTIFITECFSDFAFRAGVLNSNVNGRYLVVVQANSVNKIAEYHEGKVDLIGTEDIPNLHASINVFVAKGSNLFKNHLTRVQLQ